MGQFEFDNSDLAQLIPNFKPSDFWFLRRQFNPAHGLFTNLFLREQTIYPPVQIPDPTLGTRPVTAAILANPLAGESGGFTWGFQPFAATLYMLIDTAGLLTVNAGFPTGTDNRCTGSVQLPVGRLSFLVMAVNPGSGKLILWRNGRPILRITSPNGGGWQWGGSSNLPGSTYRTLTGEGHSNLVGVRAAIFLNQLPRGFS
jgi:hypothetical protein